MAADPWADTDHLRDLARARDKEMQALPATIAIYRASVRKRVERLKGRCPMRGAPPSSLILTITSHVAVVPQASWGLLPGLPVTCPSPWETFSEAVAQLRVGGNIADALGASVVLADMSIAAGRPCDARRLYERTLKTAEDHPGPALAIAADLHVGLADVLREAGEAEQAARHPRWRRNSARLRHFPRIDIAGSSRCRG